MKAIFLSVMLTFMLVSCTTSTSVNKEFESAISYGEIIELNQYSSEVEKQLFVRLYQSPIYKEGCFQETHGICKYRYFLSVSTFDEYPETNIFNLNEVGEITAIEWQDSGDIDTATIDLTMEKYTKMATQNNPNLVDKPIVVRVTLTPKSMQEETHRKD